LEFSLKVTGLYEDFKGRIFSVTMVKHPKPLPDIYLHVAKETGHTPPECLVIEDTVIGVTAARGARMTVIGFTGASHSTGNSEAALYNAGAKAVCQSFSDLPRVLHELGIPLS
jgi:beta-phosphoglucomutase-like phosphatase (HAD superfamily)